MAEVRILYIATAAGLVQLANPGKSDRWREIGSALDGQNVRAVAASPADVLLAYACGPGGIQRSDNGGAGWEQAGDDDATALLFDAADRIIAGTVRGAVLASADGRAWSVIAELPAEVLQLELLPDRSMLAVTADGAVGVLAGDAWQRRDAGVGDARAVAPDYRSTGAVFVAGASVLVTPQGNTPIAAPASGALLNLRGTPPALLLGTREQLLRSEDNGASLAPVDGPRDVAALVSPQRAVDQVFAGTAGGELWYSADRGRSWIQLKSGLAPIQGLAFARAL